MSLARDLHAYLSGLLNDQVFPAQSHTLASRVSFTPLYSLAGEVRLAEKRAERDGLSLCASPVVLWVFSRDGSVDYCELRQSVWGEQETKSNFYSNTHDAPL